MRNSFSSKFISIVILALIVSFLILIAKSTTEIIASSILFAILGFVIILPESFFILFMIFRPGMDLIIDRQIVGNLNCAALATIFFVLIGSMLLLKKENIWKIMEDKFMANANKAFILFLTISLFSSVHSANLLISLADWLRLVSVIIVFNYSFLYFSGRERFKKLFLLILLSAILPLCLGTYQHFLNAGNHLTQGFNRIYGTFAHPSVLAEYLLVLTITILYFLKNYKVSKILRLSLYAVLIIMLFEIFYTYSRGAWIALAISLTVFTIYHKKDKRIFYFILILIITLVFSSKIRERFTDIGHHDSSRPNSVEWRIMIWTQTLNDIKEHIVVGHGLGMYEENFLFAAHNDYLRLIYETGILGLIAYLAFLLYVFTQTIKKALHEKNINFKTKYIAITSLMTAFLIVGISDNLARSTVTLIYFFCVIGALSREEYL